MLPHLCVNFSSSEKSNKAALAHILLIHFVEPGEHVSNWMIFHLELYLLQCLLIKHSWKLPYINNGAQTIPFYVRFMRMLLYRNHCSPPPIVCSRFGTQVTLLNLQRWLLLWLIRIIFTVVVIYILTRLTNLWLGLSEVKCPKLWHLKRMCKLELVVLGQ